MCHKPGLKGFMQTQGCKLKLTGGAEPQRVIHLLLTDTAVCSTGYSKCYFSPQSIPLHALWNITQWWKQTVRASIWSREQSVTIPSPSGWRNSAAFMIHLLFDLIAKTVSQAANCCGMKSAFTFKLTEDTDLISLLSWLCIYHHSNWNNKSQTLQSNFKSFVPVTLV